MNVISYILGTIFTGIKMFGIAILMIGGLALVLGAAFVPPGLAVEAFEKGNHIVGVFWVLLTLFIYGAFYKSTE